MPCAHTLVSGSSLREPKVGYYPHFTDEDIEGKLPSSLTQPHVAEPGLTPDVSDPRAHDSTSVSHHQMLLCCYSLTRICTNELLIPTGAFQGSPFHHGQF